MKQYLPSPTSSTGGFSWRESALSASAAVILHRTWKQAKGTALVIRLRRGMASSPAGLRARPKSLSEKFCSCILPLLKGASSFSRFEDDEPSHEFKERMARASNTKSRMDDEKRKAVEVVPVPLPPSERSSAKSYDTASKLAALQK
jgi:hypothetical protein